MKIKQILLFVFTSFIPAWMMAQTAADKPEMATGLYSSGKIYVVVTVLLIILCGIFLYLFMMDRKISKLEKQHPQK